MELGRGIKVGIPNLFNLLFPLYSKGKTEVKLAVVNTN